MLPGRILERTSKVSLSPVAFKLATFHLEPALVGIIAQAFDNGAQHPDELFGRPIGATKGEYAIGDPPAGATMGVLLMARAARMVVGWRLRGQAWPHPFSNATPSRRSTGQTCCHIRSASRSGGSAVRIQRPLRMDGGSVRH
jgi:hypothetical protein